MNQSPEKYRNIDIRESYSSSVYCMAITHEIWLKFIINPETGHLPTGGRENENISRLVNKLPGYLVRFQESRIFQCISWVWNATDLPDWFDLFSVDRNILMTITKYPLISSENSLDNNLIALTALYEWPPWLSPGLDHSARSVLPSCSRSNDQIIEISLS